MSGKKHLFLTGGRGVGKTTCFSALLPAGTPGLTTWAESQRAAWMRDNLSGKTAQIGVFDESIPGTENRMKLCKEGFFELGISVVDRCIRSEGEWAGIDEIGYLECGCPEYCDAIRCLLENKRVVAVIRKQDKPFLLEMRNRDDAFCVDLDAPFGNLGCVIMASGLGKRFGGNKLMADFRGKPMIQWSLEATEGVFSKRVVVTRHPEVAFLSEKMGIDVVLHDLPYRSDTTRLGIEAMSAIDGCLFCPGDQPLLSRDTVSSIAICAAHDGEKIWRAVYKDTAGAPVLFPKWIFPELQTLPEGKGGGFLVKKYPEQVRGVSVRDEYELMDVDCPEDIKLLLER